ncbi:MAG TPA: S8 family serine peptidase [Candidatus Nanopelagicales bacterium]|nr:S8 family serine peptidase [Candidatus Nanopelagicales bacterium]
MALRRRSVALLAAPAVVLSLLVVATPATGSPAGSRAMSAPAVVAPRTITLITGDVVTYTELAGGRSSVTVRRPANAHGGIQQLTIKGHVFVIPDEALPYLAAKRVDRRLFDVTGLVEQGYDDARTGGIPLIVRYDGSARAALPGTTSTRSLPSISGAAVKVEKSRTRGMWTAITPASKRNRPTPSTRGAVTGGASSTVPPTTSYLGAGIGTVWLDGRVQPAMAESTLQIGAPKAWASGWDGDGVKVAVLDTGYDQNHPDLAGRVVGSASFVPGETVQDGHGHGTHTASTVGGSGAASGGEEKGVAPHAQLLIGKVLADGGYGEDSWVIAGMEWAAKQGAKVVSMSLGGSTPSDGTEPVCAAVNDISAASGTLFVVAAGNAGAEATISCPGAADAALTVAAVDSTDSMAWFSSQGPRYLDYGLKPDVAAPGVDILAAKAGGNATDGWYTSMSGTSMATPHVAGAAADLAEEHPGWTGQQLKDALMSTSKPIDGGTYHVGAGRIDLAAGTTDLVTATGSAYLGFSAWPHPALAPESKTITYSNSGSAPVTLDLAESVQVAGGPYDVDPSIDAGTPAPSGMFTLSQHRITVPAHGSVDVVATGDPSKGQMARRYVGQVVATDASGTLKARTQVGLYIEDERHNLTIDLRGRDGKPTAGYVQIQTKGNPDVNVVAIDESGTLTMRVLPGTYSLLSYLEGPGVDGPDTRDMVQLADPEVVLDRDRTASLDASTAVPVRATVPKKTEDRVLFLDWYRSFDSGDYAAGQYMLPSTIDQMLAQPTRTVTDGQLEFEARWRKAYPLLQLTDSGRALRVYGQGGSSLYQGAGAIRVVDVGTGSVADYAGKDVRGALAVARVSDDVLPWDRAQNAADAGAALLAVVAAPGAPLAQYVGTETGTDSAVPVFSVGASDGAALLASAAAGRRVTAEGTLDSPYVYDLAAAWQQRVPSTLVYAPAASDFATVDMRFHGATVAPGGEFRLDYRSYRPYGFGLPLRQSTGTTRIDYVAASPGTTWAEGVLGGPDLMWSQSSEVHPLAAGRRTTQDWLAPVVHPADGGGFWSSFRDAYTTQFNVQPWSDGGGHAGYIQRDDGNPRQADDTLSLKVWQDGELVKDATGFASATLMDTGDGAHRLRIDLTATRDATVWTFSPRTHTVWDVVSPPLSQGLDSVDLLPVLQVGYDVQTDLAGYTRQGRQSLRFSVTHLADAYGAGTVGGVTLAVSVDDGRHWRTVPATAAGSGWYSVSFTAPAHRFVSLRVMGSDTKGNTVRQDVIRAYGVR